MTLTHSSPEDTVLDAAELRRISEGTLGHYNSVAADFWAGTRDHDVTQNYAALLEALADRPPPLCLLDFGCGPGRDLTYFRSLGHETVGLDGAAEFAVMARAHTGCEVLCQDFLALDLPAARFDGIFANASLFHVPRQELARVLSELSRALKPRGVLFSSNPHGSNEEGWNGGRFGSYHSLAAWRGFGAAAGFNEVRHYYRPEGLPRAQQPWLATVWRKD